MAEDRGVRADARANHDRILAAARSLYAEEGLDVSFNAIARRAGVGNATLYRHFADHDELRRAIYLARVQELVQLLDALAKLEDPAAELRRYLTWVYETADLSLIVLGARGSTHATWASASDGREVEHMNTLLDDLVDRAHLGGALQADVQRPDVLVAAAALVHIARHQGITQEAGARFLDVVLRGLAP